MPLIMLLPIKLSPAVSPAIAIPTAEKPIVFVLNNEINICPVIKHMDVSDLDLKQYDVKADADKLADYLNSKH